MIVPVNASEPEYPQVKSAIESLEETPHARRMVDKRGHEHDAADSQHPLRWKRDAAAGNLNG